MVDKYISAVGRRKTSIARVRIKRGKGNIKINKRDVKSYFNRPFYETFIMQPLVVTDSVGSIDI
ncbi:MAG: 30S ribosomal protein S9, partial [Spirochaetota bacterium]|nr:30S ribosomal protein S9 [Spirochaetota bacterium]